MYYKYIFSSEYAIVHALLSSLYSFRIDVSGFALVARMRNARFLFPLYGIFLLMAIGRKIGNCCRKTTTLACSLKSPSGVCYSDEWYGKTIKGKQKEGDYA